MALLRFPFGPRDPGASSGRNVLGLSIPPVCLFFGCSPGVIARHTRARLASTRPPASASRPMIAARFHARPGDDAIRGTHPGERGRSSSDPVETKLARRPLDVSWLDLFIRFVGWLGPTTANPQ